MDGINSESSENGLIVIKIFPPNLNESQIANNIFSIVRIIDQPLYNRQFVTAC